MTRSAGAEAPAAASDRLRALLFCGAVAWMVWPLWSTRFLPIEDLPQHLAAVRVLHDFHDARYAFEQYFELSLGRTQYLAYYLIVHVLAYVLDLELANRVVMIACAAATPYALAYLLGALGKERALALFALPLTYNAHLILGFINFLMAIPAALWGLGLCVRQREAPQRWRAGLLACVATFCFFCHVVPFAFLLLGAALLSMSRDVRRMALRFLPLVPSLLIGGLWLAQSPAGHATLTAAQGGGAGPQAQYQPAAFALRDLPNWLTDVLHGPEGLQLLRGYLSLLALALLLGLIKLAFTRPWQRLEQRLAHQAGTVRQEEVHADGVAARVDGVAARSGGADTRADEGVRAVTRFARALVPGVECASLAAGRRSALACLLPLAPLAAAAYFVSPAGYDWIWPIAQRFPLLALYFVVPVLPTPPRAATLLIALALLGLSIRQQILVQRAFSAFEREEVGDLEGALAAIPEGRRVCGLIWSRGSRHVKFSPFIHAVAYYQARKGGAVMFTFADFPPSPFRFREDNRPPRVPPRWEWLPQRVRHADLQWYEYALVRGGPDPCRGRCDLRYQDGMWSVWQLRK